MKKINFKRGVNHKTVTLITALVLVVAGISYTNISSNNPIDNAKIANIMSNKDSISQSVNAYVYNINSKSMKYYSTEEIIKGISDENIRISGIVDVDSTFEIENKTLYKLDDQKCLESLNLDLSRVAVDGGDWYIDLDLNSYLVFKDYDSITKFIKKDLDDNIALKQLVKYN